jgi:DNA-binding NarL/FixJ family response regulator
MLRVWIASPHALTRAALAALATDLGLSAVADVEDADLAAIDLVTAAPPYPPAPPVPTVAIVSDSDPALPCTLGLLGYRAVLGPAAGRAELADAVARLGAQWRAAPGDPMVSVLPEGGATPLEAPLLTPREREVLELVTRGLPNKRIAARLGIAERTVKHHLSALLRKHGVRSRMRLIVQHHEPRDTRPTRLMHDGTAVPIAFASHRPSGR